MNLKSLQALYNHILELKVVTRVRCVRKVFSTKMISIDQVFLYLDDNQVLQRGQYGVNARVDFRTLKHEFTQKRLSDSMIVKAFYMSKMTVVDEHRDGNLEFTHLKFVEFLEFLARVTHFFFEETN